ncbi:DEAD/DEAH box helicase [Hyphomicrobium sp.]|uniref:DEAD/DEAH box helicase n=1 Tax=Hyphomicrobium sp. TaxID=82 RepID=UPI0025B8A2FC|nr:DEAD/DEAH box helicase [Hyphomicrobium sp.]
MEVQASALRFKPLQHTEDKAAYRLYRAALEWSLDEPIVIDSAKDLKSEPTWKAKGLTPYDHQVRNLISFCRRLPVALLADDVGLGKTISAGLVASELISRGRVKKLLIICPKLLIPQWVEELRTKFDIKAEPCAGKKLINFNPPWDVGALVTTYASARLYVDRIPQGRFDMLVLDEAHKLRNLHGASTIPQVAKKVRQVLAERRFRYVLMLTATPIQNRLWDVYSLVDLLTVARGHENPFGSPGIFTRKFIDDAPATARKLKPSSQEEFRSVVYSYMSRVRRGDAKLQFPERLVRMHAVPPSADELRLIATIAEPIQSMNRLAQISILQALVSSPDALRKQLENMAARGTFPAAVSREVTRIVEGMGLSAKIVGVGALADQLRSDMPDTWRMVVFTTRRETQISIEKYLSERGIRVGTINGDSGERNQDTLEAFRADPPKCNVIVSTEAGAEGVNLQAANVLVNYDLPLNPMIVEQRIGRIQRLQSKFANVCIYNITLAGTFEQYIVGRLMEKLQMAAHAIGDIESLLEASGFEDEEGEGFAEQIRKLVVKSLAGINVESAAQMAAQSIADAKARLETEERNIDGMLGGMDEGGYQGPKTPTLPRVNHSMSEQDFTINALQSLGTSIQVHPAGGYRIEREGAVELIHFGSGPVSQGSVLYASGTPSFERLVDRLTDRGRHQIRDRDERPIETSEAQAEEWVKSFQGLCVSRNVINGARAFKGNAIVRVRATVAHDSYDRIVDVPCNEAAFSSSVATVLEETPEVIADPSVLGLDRKKLIEAAMQDEGVSEFCRFYKERRSLEIGAAGGDERKRKKLEDEFTPRLAFELVALEGFLSRALTLACRYRLTENGREYESTVTFLPSTLAIVQQPAMARCETLSRIVPEDVLGTCAVSGGRHILDILAKSEASGRLAVPAHVVTCALTGKRVLSDEIAISDITGQPVLQNLLKQSALSGKTGELSYFGTCAFTGIDALRDELLTSAISGKLLRFDQQATSGVSGKIGHVSEFIACTETRVSLTSDEAERCSITENIYRPGILERCGETGQLMHPREMEKCDVLGKSVNRALLLTSEMSGRRACQRHFAKCNFTNATVLRDELAMSQLSDRAYRKDEALVSSFSGRVGHRSEFFHCSITNQFVAGSEGERCAVTGTHVAPSVLEVCTETGQRVIPGELERCTVSGRKALKRLLVASSLSGRRMLEKEAVVAVSGQYCAPDETEQCEWDGNRYHPADILVCDLTGLPHHRKHSTPRQPQRLRPISELLDGISRRADHSHLWEEIATQVKPVLGRCHVEAAHVSSDGRSLAVGLAVKRMLGLRTVHAGMIYDLASQRAIGRVICGQRAANGWIAEKA